MPNPEPQADLAAILARVDGIDRRLTEVHEILTAQRVLKEKYTTAEVAEVLGKAEFTVREWCRLGRVRAEKRACGRGASLAWMVSHQELTRLRNDGILPLPATRPACER